MKPLWKLRSGKFAGWRKGDRLYNASGENIGYFVDDTAYSLQGRYIGELRGDDRIGKRDMVIKPSRGARAKRASIARMPRFNRFGKPILGWSDPDF